MPIEAVFLSADTYLACLNHALSTEKEEIMGLLLGHVVHKENDSDTSGVSANSFAESVIILQRSDRKADRVEISPLQLTAAAQEAESLSAKLNKPLRVLGWYHSHPHITVWPSHIDIRTQSVYQMMDPDFVGVIFSVFQHEDEKFASISVTCFQSVEHNSQLISKEIPIRILPQSKSNEHCLKALIEVPSTLYREEKELYEKANRRNPDAILECHNQAVYTQTLCQLVESCELPCLSALNTYEKSLECKLRELQHLKRQLEQS